ELLAGGFVEAENALDFRGVQVVGDVDAALRDDRPRVPVSDSCVPADRKPGRGDAVDDAGFAPDAVALRPAPLRPVISTGVDDSQKQRGERREQAEAGRAHGRILIWYEAPQGHGPRTRECYSSLTRPGDVTSRRPSSRPGRGAAPRGTRRAPL